MTACKTRLVYQTRSLWSGGSIPALGPSALFQAHCQALSISNVHPWRQPHQAIHPSRALYVSTAFSSAAPWKCTSHFPILFLLVLQVSPQMFLPTNISNFIKELITLPSVPTYNIARFNTVFFVCSFLF